MTERRNLPLRRTMALLDFERAIRDAHGGHITPLCNLLRSGQHFYGVHLDAVAGLIEYLIRPTNHLVMQGTQEEANRRATSLAMRAAEHQRAANDGTVNLRSAAEEACELIFEDYREENRPQVEVVLKRLRRGHRRPAT